MEANLTAPGQLLLDVGDLFSDGHGDGRDDLPDEGGWHGVQRLLYSGQ